MALILVVAGAIYGYARWRLGQIKAIACPSCAPVADGAPYNVLLVGSDSRAGNSGGAAQAFGNAQQVAGQRSDTIKIIHIDPSGGTARMLSIPRDTYVRLSGVPSSTGLAADNKINTSFNSGPDALIQTIQNTLGIPIAHFVVVDFGGVINLVNAVHGINLNFPYPVRDNDNGNNNSGLLIPQAGCQNLNGNMALALARSRYYEYEVRPGHWAYDGTGDLGRITRQNLVIEATIDKAKSSYNPLTLNSFVGAAVHDVTVDKGMSSGTMFGLAQRYHAFSGSSLQSATLPTVSGYSHSQGDVQVVQEPEAAQAIAQFLGGQPNSPSTPPLDAYGSPISVPKTPPTTAAPAAPSKPAPASPAAPAPPPSQSSPSFDPTPC